MKGEGASHEFFGIQRLLIQKHCKGIALSWSFQLFPARKEKKQERKGKIIYGAGKYAGKNACFDRPEFVDIYGC